MKCDTERSKNQKKEHAGLKLYSSGGLLKLTMKYDGLNTPRSFKNFFGAVGG
jgi:hypothetical protein